MRVNTDFSVDYDFDDIFLNGDMSNKLFCTFSTQEDLDNVLTSIQERYKIIYSKIFVLYSKSQNEYICTYTLISVMSLLF